MDRNTILETVTLPRGILEVSRPRVDVLHFRAEGLLELPAAQVVVRWVEEALSATTLPVTTFSDWHGVTDYEPAARSLLTQFMRDHLARVGHTFILVRWRGVQMGVTLANAILGGPIKVFVDPRAFAQACGQVLDGTIQTGTASVPADYWPRPPAAG